MRLLLREFDKVGKRRKVKVNPGKIKVIVYARIGRGNSLNLSWNGVMLEEVDSSKYLGFIIGKNWGVFKDVIGRMKDGQKVFDLLFSGP